MTERVETILIEYTSSDSSAFRFARLRKAERFFVQIAGLTAEQVGLLVAALHDQKGELWIDWRVTPSDAQRRAFESAWLLCEERIVHHASYAF
jgi:hypothetical protein